MKRVTFNKQFWYLYKLTSAVIHIQTNDHGTDDVQNFICYMHGGILKHF